MLSGELLKFPGYLNMGKGEVNNIMNHPGSRKDLCLSLNVEDKKGIGVSEWTKALCTKECIHSVVKL